MSCMSKVKYTFAQSPRFLLCQLFLQLKLLFLQRYQVDSANAQRARWERETRSLIGQISKNCPGCKSPTEKTGKQNDNSASFPGPSATSIPYENRAELNMLMDMATNVILKY